MSVNDDLKKIVVSAADLKGQDLVDALHAAKALDRSLTLARQMETLRVNEGAFMYLRDYGDDVTSDMVDNIVEDAVLLFKFHEEAREAARYVAAEVLKLFDDDYGNPMFRRDLTDPTTE